MSVSVPKVLILGHSFVRRLRDDLDAQFDDRASKNFHLPESANVSLYGTGGRTVEKLLKYDLICVLNFRPDIILLEIGTNDLSHSAPEVVGSKIEEFARLLRDQYKVRVVGVCQVIDRKVSHSEALDTGFNAKAALLRQYLSVVLENEQAIFLWSHRDFSLPDRKLICSDGVHCNAKGQYALYRSYRGAVLKALSLLA